MNNSKHTSLIAEISTFPHNKNKDCDTMNDLDISADFLG
jgi:hypothetical protein